MRQPNVARNKAIVILHQADPQLFSFGVLSHLLGLKRGLAHKIYHRDKPKYKSDSDKASNTKK